MRTGAGEERLCSKCGAPLPADAPQGICPRCEFLGALALLPTGSAPEPHLGSEPAPAISLPGCRFGNFELLEEIARGGMGIVYRARQVNLDRVVAVKMLLGGLVADKQFVQRFRAEAGAAAVLQHPNIVAVHDVGVEHGQHYFSMELVEGQNLAQLVGQQPLVPARAARYVRLVAQAIEYAHAQGILHRDLKPSNVLIDASDQPRVTDFGLAKRLDCESSLSMTGQVLGSPNFIPPEQASSDRGKVGRYSDVYGLGGILYFLLTARAPFQAHSLEAVVTQVLTAEPISPRLLNPAVPRDLETICLKCLEKEPRRRYQTSQDMAAELDRFLRNEPILARPLGSAARTWRWCRRNPQVTGLAAGILAAIAVGFAGVLGQWNRAEQNALESRTHAEESRVRLVRSYVDRGASLAEAGDMTGAVLWFAEALRLDEHDAARAEMHRFRLGAALSRCPKLLHLYVHDGKVQAADFSADGRKIVTASSDQSARVWDANTGEPLTPPLKHRGEVISAALSRDGLRAVTNSVDKTAQIWDARSGAPLTPPLQHEQLVNHAAFSPDDLYVATASADRTAWIWDAVTGKPITPPLQHAGSVWRVEFSPDGERIVTASGFFFDRTTGEAVIWDAKSGNEITRMSHQGQVWTAEFSPDGRRIVTSSFDRTGRVWDARTGDELVRLAHGEGLHSAVFSPDGNRIATSSEDKSAKVWNSHTGELIATVPHDNWLMWASFSVDGRWIATASWDKTARAWDAATGLPMTPPLQHMGLAWFASFSPEGRRVLTASGDKTVRVWDIGAAWALPRTSLGASAVDSATFSHDGRIIITLEGKRVVRLWDAKSGNPLFAPLEHIGRVVDLDLSRDGRRLETASDDNLARVWDVETGEILFTVEYAWSATRVAFSPDGRRLATAWHEIVRVSDALTGEGVTAPWDVSGPVNNLSFSPDSRSFVTSTGLQLTGGEAQARVWDVNTGQPITPPLRHANTVITAWFSPDGRSILTASDDGTARIWDATTGRELTPPLRHNGELRHASFSLDGSRVVTTSLDSTAQIWDAATGQPITAPLVHHKGVSLAAFSPDGRRVATTTSQRFVEGGEVRVWDAATAEPVAPPLPHSGLIESLAFSADGRHILTVSGGQAWLWDFPTEERRAADLMLLAQSLSARRIVSPGDMVPMSSADLRRAWQSLRAKYPAEFALAKDEMLGWHRREAEVCESSGQWFAARFHLDRLLAGMPADESLRQRRARAETELNRLSRIWEGETKAEPE